VTNAVEEHKRRKRFISEKWRGQEAGRTLKNCPYCSQKPEGEKKMEEQVKGEKKGGGTKDDSPAMLRGHPPPLRKLECCRSCLSGKSRKINKEGQGLQNKGRKNPDTGRPWPRLELTAAGKCE